LTATRIHPLQAVHQQGSATSKPTSTNDTTQESMIPTLHSQAFIRSLME
jgi:hypothetical protein